MGPMRIVHTAIRATQRNFMARLSRRANKPHLSCHNNAPKRPDQEKTEISPNMGTSGSPLAIHVGAEALTKHYAVSRPRSWWEALLAG